MLMVAEQSENAEDTEKLPKRFATESTSVFIPILIIQQDSSEIPL